MTIPSAATKVHLDSGTDDPRQARAELADLVDKFNTLRSHLGTSAITSGSSVLGIGEGLEAAGGNLRLSDSAIALLRITGEMADYLGSTAPTGWILADGRTIGNAASGATNRANDDTEALFALLWNDYDNSILPVSGGRGASASADFAANKTIQVPDLRGRATFGKDDMGGTAANRVTTSGSGISATVLGASGGTETVSLTANQNGPHAHFYTDPINGINQNQPGATGNSRNNINVNSGTTTQSGTGAPHQNMSPSWVVNKIIKL